MNKANAKTLGYVGSANHTRKSNEWYTPHKYIEAAIHAMDGIDLDPFSSAEANRIVAAPHYFTEEDDAFTKDWSEVNARSCWMNPPYSGQLVAAAVNKFIDEWQVEAFDCGIILVNNATETRWFQRALTEAHSVCFTNHRISFWNADGKAISGNTRGQAFIYFHGHGRPKFRNYFRKFGAVVKL